MASSTDFMISHFTPSADKIILGIIQLAEKAPKTLKEKKLKQELLNQSLLESLYIKNVKAALALIEAGADINCTTQDGITPLHFAAQNGLLEIIPILLKKGANINAKDKHGYTPLMLAIYGDEPRKIAKTPQIEHSIRGAFWISDGVHVPKVDVVKMLTFANADLSIEGPSKMTALHIAAMITHVDLFNFLVKQGAPIDTVTDPLAYEGGSTPIELALRRSPSGFARYHKRADLNNLLNNITLDESTTGNLVLAMQHGVKIELSYRTMSNENRIRLVYIFPVVGPIFNQSLMRTLAQCIEVLYLQKDRFANRDLALSDRSALHQLVHDNFDKIKEILFVTFANELEAAQEILSREREIDLKKGIETSQPGDLGFPDYPFYHGNPNDKVMEALKPAIPDYILNVFLPFRNPDLFRDQILFGKALKDHNAAIQYILPEILLKLISSYLSAETSYAPGTLQEDPRALALRERLQVELLGANLGKEPVAQLLFDIYAKELEAKAQADTKAEFEDKMKFGKLLQDYKPAKSNLMVPGFELDKAKASAPMGAKAPESQAPVADPKAALPKQPSTLHP